MRWQRQSEMTQKIDTDTHTKKQKQLRRHCKTYLNKCGQCHKMQYQGINEPQSAYDTTIIELGENLTDVDTTKTVVCKSDKHYHT